MNRKTLILGGVLIVLIVLAYLYQGPLKKWQKNLSQPRNILAMINKDKIDKIEITAGGSTTTLTKQGDAPEAKWKWNNTKDFYANPTLVSEALTVLGQAANSRVELISNQEKRKNEFKTNQSGTEVTLYQADKKITDFIIGDRTSDYNGVYLSKVDLPATYSVNADLFNAFNQPEWRDQTIFSTDKSKINKIRFQYPNREFSVALVNGSWVGVLPEKFIVNQDKIKKIIELISSLKARAIPEQTFKNTGLEKHSIIVQATGEGIDNVLMIGGSQGELSYAKRGDSDNIYLIDKASRDELDKWIWQLR